jgi:hypothetical protein
MKNLSNQSHYENASKDFKTSEEQILDDETVNKMREKFTMTNLDSRVEDALPIINRIMSELEAPKDEEPVNELDPGDEPIDAPIQAPVDHGAVVQSFLTDPENKLVLRKDPTADKMLSATKFTDKNTMLGSILSDIASRLLTKSGEEDRVANFASRVADGIEQEGSNSFKPGPDYNSNKKIAVQLAKRYIDDYKKMQQDPAYADEVRMDPADFSPKKNIKGKAIGKETEAFEGWVDSMIDEGGIKPYVSMSRGEDDGKMRYNVLDRNEKTIFSSVDQEEAQDFLKLNYDKLRAGEMEVASGGVDTVDVDEYAKGPKDEEDREAKLKALQDLQMDPKLKDPESVQAMVQRKKELMKEPVAAEGNEFANAVRKAKAAGMKSGDKFNVGDKEYTLKDAIEMAGLQLEEFFTPEDNAPDMVVRDPEDEAEDKEQEIAKDQQEAEKINTELDRIKQLANI